MIRKFPDLNKNYIINQIFIQNNNGWFNLLELYLEAFTMLLIHCKQLSRISGLVSNSKLLSVVHSVLKSAKWSVHWIFSLLILFNAVLINFKPFC